MNWEGWTRSNSFRYRGSISLSCALSIIEDSGATPFPPPPLLSNWATNIFRVTAMSVLPLGSNTLIYGSSNAGMSVVAMNPQMNRIMDTIAKRLNLRYTYTHFPPPSLIRLVFTFSWYLSFKTTGRTLGVSANVIPPVSPQISKGISARMVIFIY